MAFYRELSRERNEVRMLTIIDSPPGGDASLVHCTLENVSLSFSFEYRQFLEETGLSSDYTALRSWLRDDDSTFRHGSAWSPLKLPLWRWIMEYGKETEGLDEWLGIMEAAGTDTFKCPSIPTQRNDLSLRKISVRITRMIHQDYPLQPRFPWGDFEAISYCWESDVRDRQIIINNTPFDVPRNLEALLQRLRTLPDTKAGMKFWVDALCVNQSNVAERNYQVRLMKDIYTKAFAVVVWLGAASDDSNLAIDFIASITKFTLGNRKDEEFAFDNWDTRSRGAEEKRIFQELPWKALLSFLNRDYWRRLWIIQELSLNHNMTLFLCGDRQLSRSMIARMGSFCEKHIRVIDQLVSRSLVVERAMPSSLYGSIWPTIYHINKLVMMGIQPGHGVVDDILDLGRKASATDARDKVYGILGLLPSELSATISPDYAKSNTETEVYQGFAKKMIHAFSRLDTILSWCSHTSLQLPSWVPDWTTTFPRNHLQWLRKRRADGSTPARWTITNEGRHLRCRGFIVDHVLSKAASQSEYLPFKTGFPAHKDAVHNRPQPHRYGNTEGLSAAVRRVLTTEIPDRFPTNEILDIFWVDWSMDEPVLQDNSQPLQELADDSQECQPIDITKELSWEVFDRFRQTNAQFPLFGNPLVDFFPKTRQKLLARSHAGMMLRSVLTMVGRRLITTKGGYLGHAPEAVQNDDVIAILYGCSFPVVLRPYGDLYTVIGESFIDGLMDGEGVEAQRRGEYEEVDITLC